MIVLIFVSGCSWFTRTIDITTRPASAAIIHPEDPRPLSMGETHFRVINSSNIDEYIRELEQESSNYRFYAMSPQTYNILIGNLADIRRYIIQQKEIIIYYRELHEEQ
jgi:hypothetical protein